MDSKTLECSQRWIIGLDALIVNHCVDAAVITDPRTGLRLYTVALNNCSELQCSAKLSFAVEAKLRELGCDHSH